MSVLGTLGVFLDILLSKSLDGRAQHTHQLHDGRQIVNVHRGLPETYRSPSANHDQIPREGGRLGASETPQLCPEGQGGLPNV